MAITGNVQAVASVGAAPEEPAAAPLSTGCTVQEEDFARALVESGNRSLAYRRAYNVAVHTKPSSIWSAASQVAHRPHVQAYVRVLQEQIACASIANKQVLIKFLWDRILADRRELMNQHTYNCRHCYGERGLYMWKDEEEFALELCRVLDLNSKLEEVARKPLPTDDGGYGFDAHRAPNPACEHDKCMGHGFSRTVFADTTTLQGAAALCYEGMKVTAQGVEMKIADRATDITLLSKLLGWSVDKVESTVNNARSGALPPEAYDIPSTATPEEATRKYLAIV